MSHFAELQVEYRAQNESSFVAALEEVFGKGNVEVHERPVGLFGVEGRDRSKLKPASADYAPECHIVIRRKNVGSAANDIGFRRLEDGTYSAYISEYDQVRNFGPERQGQLLQAYGVRVSEKQLSSQGYSTTRQTREDGTVQIIATKW